MALGGARPGAGRKKGGANRINDEARKKALEDGLSPLEYLLGVMRDIRQDDARRLDAAKAAAPYVHARLANVAHTRTIKVRCVSRSDGPNNHPLHA